MTPEASGTTHPDLAARLSTIDAKIVDAARLAGRDPGEITRIVVTKFHPASLVQDLAALGVREVGENRQQELSAKQEELADLDVRWHFIGQAQTKKAGAIRRSADVVHSVDRDRLADALHRAAVDDTVLDVLVQINLTDDAARGGVAPGEASSLAEHVLSLPSLRLRGVMAVAPLDEEPASAFARLNGVAEAVRALEPAATWISAGMTGDFVEAIAAGATHLRIGSAITGPRPDRG
ncbi:MULTISPECIES: YggS family pyridoxal phosphate-dependent enzyme [unclassified Microbacterium]|uniref:YggS family pyridoxal phosphate-dependent enzyme n=1 Tax=unclassified Microbacterium TaxID=2609290 RepID=UPI000EA9488D|nr:MULTISPECIES: YggS family pyridoxal phosphate-dependent enzyme [unclassified Microbacterium]MBT2486335.1 YggS family pyridoxal phosphate-dependent enzyme [Microbacterium sp. ISL-108]RKN69046.1 YggS family pyridoxal phosphate-dependent enzyme [Microbacterium sp. CGR2]